MANFSLQQVDTYFYVACVNRIVTSYTLNLLARSELNQDYLTSILGDSHYNKVDLDLSMSEFDKPNVTKGIKFKALKQRLISQIHEGSTTITLTDARALFQQNAMLSDYLNENVEFKLSNLRSLYLDKLKRKLSGLPY